MPLSLHKFPSLVCLSVASAFSLWDLKGLSHWYSSPFPTYIGLCQRVASLYHQCQYAGVQWYHRHGSVVSSPSLQMFRVTFGPVLLSFFEAKISAQRC